MDADQKLREELLDYLDSACTHKPLTEAAKDFPAEFINRKVEGAPYSPWGLLEHIRITQRDMVNFIENHDYKEMDWPKDYWPKRTENATRKMWENTLAEYLKDLEALRRIVKDPKNDLLSPIPRGSGQTILKEVMQIVDHTSYHTGELVLARRNIGAWKE